MAEKLHPLAITMWDFSWIERRWDGAGFADWDAALDQLVERGYDAVRIDAFPHLISADPQKEWLLLPVWYANDWGAPYKVRVTLMPALLEFLEKCRARRIKVALSSWFREDAENVRMQLSTPEAMARCWVDTLRMIEAAGLMDTLLYVDLCNEFPGDFWAPYFRNDPPWMTWSCWHTEAAMAYMRTSIELVRREFPMLPLCFSFDGDDTSHYPQRDFSFMDLAEHHIWMTKLNKQQFYNEVGKAKDGRYTEEAYHLLADHALEVYEGKKDYWQQLLVQGIQRLAQDVKAAGLPLATTECWGITDYKDFPMLPWDWVRELCALGVETACQTGQWALIATSNFAAPQFCGMWQDVHWHRELTDRIHQAALPAELAGSPLARTMCWQDDKGDENDA